MDKPPKHFQKLVETYGPFMDCLKKLGEAAQESGPLDAKTAHLIQLAAAAALRSEGAVHSHARRALASGSTIDEVKHALILITPTIGFPAVAAALSWVEDLK